MATRVLPTGTVTMVFTDIEGSTRLLERAGERYPYLLAAHNRVLREVWAEHGGVEEGTEGDAFFVVFVDEGEAVAAAREGQRRLAAFDWPAGLRVRVRMGVHTGLVEQRDGGVWGADIHYAARLASAAHGGQVLLSGATADLVDAEVAALGEHGFKDFAEPRPIFQLVVDGEGPEAFPPPRTLNRVATNLPAPPDALIGRRGELDDLARRMLSDRRRLLTLTGPGGSGKTRVAIALARRVLGSFPDGVFFVALDELSAASAVPTAIAAALQIPETTLDRVAEHLAERRVLLVLDNMEHLLDAAPVAQRLVEAGDGVQVLATSQAPLRVAGEEVVTVAPLPVPTDGNGDLDALARVPAVALLLERARSAAPGFALTAANSAAVRDLCARLDGLPLALELAAARLDVIEPGALVRRLDAGLDALGAGGRGRPDRHRGLRAALDWTSALLTPGERATLGRLSVFRGGFTLDLAEAALGDGDVIEDLAKLRDVGLVRRDEDGRFSMAPPVRRYAGELLAAAGEEQAAARGMARALADVAHELEEAWFIPFVEASRTLNAEASNILEALTWSRTADPLLHADLAAAVGWWLPYSGRREVAAEHLPIALATAADDPVLRARVNEALGVGGPASVDPDGPTRAADTWRELGNQRRLASALWGVANNHFHFGRVEEAERAATEGLEVATGLGDEALILDAHVQLGQAALVAGRPADSIAELEPLLAHTPPGHPQRFSVATCLADAELAGGCPDAALVTFGEALRAIEGGGMPALEIIQADSMVVALAQLGRTEEAALALALSELLHAQYAMPIIGPAEEYAQLAAELPPDARERGRQRAARIGPGGAIAWFRGVGSG